MKILLRIFAAFLCCFQLCVGSIYYVDPSVFISNERTGAWSRPFASIQDCIDRLNYPGDECHIRAGKYHESVKISGLTGTPEKPIVIRGYKDERPILDGTIEIKSDEWNNTGTGKIYRTQITTDIWQLFVDDLMMTNARWPNAKWSDKSLFNGSIWSGLSASSKRGHIVNKGDSLGQTNLDMTGALAILNIGSFNTFVAKVKEHKAKSNSFTFDDNFGDYHFKASRSRYFLEDKLNLMDAPEEWFYDKVTKTLYVWTPTGDTPAKSNVRGKVQSYAINITNSSHVILWNLDFFATTIRADSTNASYRTNNITFHSLNFMHHTYSKRMLGDIGLIDWTEINGIYDKRRPDTWGTFTFFNNTFYGSDGLVLSYHGINVTIDNNLFEYNDFTAANMIKASGGLGTVKSDSTGDVFVRNTLRYNGASAGLRPGRSPTVMFNDISKQCWGIIQNDGAGVQLTTKPQVGSRVENNWIHDQPKYGLRFDGEPPRVGTHGSMLNNVVARCNGLMVKGDYHNVSHNLAFEKVNGKDSDGKGTGCALCVLKFVRTNPVEINKHTMVSSNVADVANGGVIKKKGQRGKFYPVAGSTVENNVFGQKVTKLLMDPDNFDFRPQKGSKVALMKAGPYLYEENMKYYWIPGRQIYKSSSPIPPNKSVSVKALNRDAVMWLNAYDCDSHDVYFGKGKSVVESADENSPEFQGTAVNGSNVMYLKETVKHGETYYWRVDAITRDSTGERAVYKGDVWTFSTV